MPNNIFEFLSIEKKGINDGMAKNFLLKYASTLSKTEFSRQLVSFLQTANSKSLTNLGVLGWHLYLFEKSSLIPNDNLLIQERFNILKMVTQKATLAKIQEIIKSNGSDDCLKRCLPDILVQCTAEDKHKTKDEYEIEDKFNAYRKENKTKEHKSKETPDELDQVINKLTNMIERLEKTNIFARAFGAITGRAELTSKKIAALYKLRDSLAEKKTHIKETPNSLSDLFDYGVLQSTIEMPVSTMRVSKPSMPLKELLGKQRFSFFNKETTSSQEMSKIEKIINSPNPK